MDMMNQKDKGRMLSIIIGHPGDEPGQSGEDDGIEAAKEVGKALGIELDDDKAADLYRALDLAYQACKGDDMGESEGPEEDSKDSTY